MDKSTLSNYGWIIIVTLILAVMLALATPFGTYVGDGVVAVANSFVKSADNAMDEDNIDTLKSQWEGKLDYSAVTDTGNKLNHKGIIPEGAFYVTNIIAQADSTCCDSYGFWCVCDAVIYKEGDRFPATVNQYDLYVYDGYAYMYNADYDCGGCPYGFNINGISINRFHGNCGSRTTTGWTVQALNNDANIILSHINNEPVENMMYTFAYIGVSNAHNVVIPNTIKDMRYTFYCASFTQSPVIPEGVENMNATFMFSYLVTAPTIPSSVTNMDSTFYGCESLATAPTIPSGVTNMYGTFSYCTSLTTAPAIPNSVTNMDSTFACCTSLTTAPTIPNSVTDMGSTFAWCTSLATAPTIPNSVTNMDSTFLDCISLTTAPAIPNSVTNMASAFSDCTSLITAPAIPNSVTNMNSAFSYCKSLTTAPTIPSSVTTMSYTFNGCTSLTGTITINANPTNYTGCFVLYSTGKPITLTGSSTMLQALANTSNSLYRTITIQ